MMDLKLHRRTFLHLAAGAAALPALPHIARAQTYPSRRVRLVVPAAAGNSVDILARMIGQWLSERLGQPFVIENMPGAGGNIGTEAVARAPADGYTLLYIAAGAVINPSLYTKLNFDFLRDIAPVAGVSRAANVLVVNQSFPARTVLEFIAYAKANPGKINFASPGIGTSIHMSGEMFKTMAEVNMIHVPYRSTALALTDLIGGQVQAIFDNFTTSVGHIKDGKLRALGVTSAARSKFLPDIPAIAEFLPDYEAVGQSGIGALKNTPTEIVDRLNREINAALADPKIKARFDDLATSQLVLSPADYGKLNAAEIEKWGKVIRAANIKPG